MKNLKVHHVGFFNKKEHYIQEIRYLFFFFQISGLRRMSINNFPTKDSAPFCYLFFPGDKFEFEFNEKRENWVVQFSYSEIQCISNEQFSFGSEDENIILPRYLEVDKDDLMRWLNKFKALHMSFMTPTPHEQVLTQLYLLDILKYYIEAVGKEGQSSPAAKLKQLIDISENMRFSIAELSEKCAYSADHLRVLFKNKYEISPQEYRMRRIMAYAMELICKSTLLGSDISEECGFKYLSHFSSLFKKIHGIAPTAALKRFRYR